MGVDLGRRWKTHIHRVQNIWINETQKFSNHLPVLGCYRFVGVTRTLFHALF